MENLIAQIQPTFESIIAAITKFSDETFNAVPFKGSWTAGQVAEHVKLSIQGLPDVMEGSTKSAGREPDQNIAAFAKIFLDFDTKLKSPEFVLPESRKYGKQEFIEFYASFAERIDFLAQRLDLTQLCLDFDFPTLGKQTRLEFLAFLLFHTQRHTRQLEKIWQALYAQNHD